MEGTNELFGGRHVSELPAARVASPRVRPLRADELSERQRALFAMMPPATSVRLDALDPVHHDGVLVVDGQPILNLYATIGRSPDALERFHGWGGYVFSEQGGNTMPPRQRELVILRVGRLCRSRYEVGKHEALGRRAGLTDEELARIGGDPDVGWSASDATLLRAATELVDDHFISDATWAALGEFFDERQCMDLVFTVGHYTQVSMALNTFGVQLEPGSEPGEPAAAATSE